MLSAELCRGSVARTFDIIAHECAHVLLKLTDNFVSALNGYGDKEAADPAVKWLFVESRKCLLRQSYIRHSVYYGTRGRFIWAPTCGSRNGRAI